LSVSDAMKKVAEETKKEIEVKTRKDVFPQDGWLKSYMDYSSYSESPTLFHFWVGIGTLSAVLQRNVWVDYGYMQLFPNFLIILVGPTGIMKSSAIKISTRNLLSNLEFINMLSDKVTPERLIHVLKKGKVKLEDGVVRSTHDAIGFIQASELSVFFGKQSYNEGLIQLITDLADCPDKWETSTFTRGDEMLKNVHVTMLGGTTPEWMHSALPDTAAEGGFFGRFIWVFQAKSDRCVSWPSLPEGLDTSILVEELNELHKLKGKFEVSAVARKWFDDWYREGKKKIIVDPKTLGYFARRHVYLLKLGMILAASRFEMEISVARMEEALMLLEDMEKFLPKIYEYSDMTAQGKNQHRILSQLRRSGEVVHSELLAMNSKWLDSFSFRKVMDTLYEMRLIERKTLHGLTTYSIKEKP